MAKITYGDKVGIVPPEVRINQVQDVDMNEIKNVVNTNADDLETVEQEVDVNTLLITELIEKEYIIPLSLDDYVDGQLVEKNTQIGNGEQLVISNKQTTDYPFVSLSGQPHIPTTDFPDTYIADEIITAGNQYKNVLVDLVINKIKVFVPDLNENSTFTVYLQIYDVTPDDGKTLTYSNIPLSPDVESIFSISSQVVGKGQSINIYMISSDSASNTTWSRNYIYTGAVSSAVLNGEANTSPNHQLVRVSFRDADNNWVEDDLKEITVGSYIQYTQGTNYELYQVTELRDDDGTTTSFVCNMVRNLGTLVVDDPMTFDVEIPIASGSKFSYNQDYWLTNSQTWCISQNGAMFYGSIEQTGNENNAFSVDIQVEEILKSDDWDVLVLTTLGASTETTYTYDFVKVYDILDIPEEPTWTPIASLTSQTTIGSVYEYKMSIQGFMADTNDSARIRYRINGGDWFVYSKEAKDVNDIFGFSYLFPLDDNVTESTFELEAQKQSGGNTFNINFADLIIQKVKN